MKKVLLLAMLTLVMGAGVLSASAQSFKVSGTVTYEEDGTPVIGATVLVEESGTVTSTDIDGKYQITIPSSVKNKVLKVNYIGLVPQEKAATANGQVIDFSMIQDLQQIENVVVTGYGSARKIGTVVGSVEQVTAKDLENRPSSSVMDALQGKVAGLQIFTSSGEPSETQTIRLHGVGSLGSSSQPLYILDGIQVSQATIQAMNPNDFESITVLKDASATSIYGSRAANGVIVYTTKRGTAGNAQINIRAQYGVSTQATTTFYDNLMNTDQLWAFQKEMGWISDADILDYTKKGYNQTTNWFRYYQKEWAPVYQGDVSIAGGNENTTYYLSGGIFNQEGTAAESYYNKYNFRANVASKVKEWMTVGANAQLFYDEQNTNAGFGSNYIDGGMSYLNNPMYPTYNPLTGEEYWDEKIPGAGLYNPKYVAQQTPYRSSSYGTSSSLFMTIEPIKNLKITSRGGLEFIYRDVDSKRLPTYIAAPGNGGYGKTAANYLTATISNTVEYAFDIADDHSLTALIGQEGIAYNSGSTAASASGIEDNDLMQLQYGKQSTYSVSSSSSAYSYLSYFGTLNYAWGDKLYVDATVRNDQSSRFGANNQSATFWAVGARWDFKNTLLKDNETITDLAAKVSYGTQGNSEIGNFTWQGQYGVISRYQDNAGLGVVNPYNPNLTWETQSKLTVAANISLWNRLNIDFEYYRRETTDMLMSVPLPSTSGFGSIMRNIGGLRNEGVDVSIDYDILRDHDYWLNFSFNFNYNNQTITSLFDGRQTWTVPSTGITYAVGQAVSFYYPLYAGLNKETGKQQWYLPGDDFTQTTKGEVTENYNDTALNQNTGIAVTAPIAGGFAISGQWKGLSLQADFAYVLNKYLLNNDAYFTLNPGQFAKAGYNTTNAVTDYWTPENPNAKFPNWNDPDAITQFDSHLLEDASFMRLKNLTIGYAFPKSILGSQDVVNGFKVYFTGRNLLTLTKFTGIDPEIDANLSVGAMPNSKQFVFGVELTF